MGQTSYIVELTEAAAADLIQIDAYWTQQEEAWRGEKYYHDLMNVARNELSVAETARRGRRFRSEKFPEAREILAFGIYRIIYEIDEPAQRVNILRFWHAHRREPRDDL